MLGIESLLIEQDDKAVSASRGLDLTISNKEEMSGSLDTSVRLSPVPIGILFSEVTFNCPVCYKELGEKKSKDTWKLVLLFIRFS